MQGTLGDPMLSTLWQSLACRGPPDREALLLGLETPRSHQGVRLLGGSWDLLLMIEILHDPIYSTTTVPKDLVYFGM